MSSLLFMFEHFRRTGFSDSGFWLFVSFDIAFFTTEGGTFFCLMHNQTVNSCLAGFISSFFPLHLHETVFSQCHVFVLFTLLYSSTLALYQLYPGPRSGTCLFCPLFLQRVGHRSLLLFQNISFVFHTLFLSLFELIEYAALVYITSNLAVLEHLHPAPVPMIFAPRAVVLFTYQAGKLVLCFGPLLQTPPPSVPVGRCRDPPLYKNLYGPIYN